MQVRFTATALQETAEILSYIAAHNPRAAVEIRERIESAARRLSGEPFSGPRTDEPTVRQLTVRRSPYLIYYVVERGEVVILHVRHGARRRLWETEGVSKVAPLVSPHTSPDLVVRALLPEDLPETLAVWIAAWQAAYPQINFAARCDWMADHIAELQRTGSQALIALRGGRIVGALIVNPATGYLDQIVAGVEEQGRGLAGRLLAEARRLSPRGLELHVNKDNARAIRFYEKNGFVITGDDINPRSGAPIYRMTWRPE